jgi:hypothetical protein
LSQSQICRDLKEIKRRWQSAHRQELATLQAKEIARNEHIEQTAWAAWHKSCEPEETQSQEKSTTEGDAEDGCIASNEGQKSRLKASIRTKGRYGSQGFLKIIMECAKERRKLLGMDSVKVGGSVPRILYIAPNVSVGGETKAAAQQLTKEQTIPDEKAPERQPPPKRLQFQITEPKSDPLRQALDEYAKEAGNSPLTTKGN